MEKIYRDVKIVDGLKVSIDGEFIYNGKYKKVYKNQKPYNNHKTTAVIHIRKDGKLLYFQASKLVASAWKVGYNANEDYIIYHDGDCQNIHADNLQIVNKDRYWQYMQRNSGNKADDIEKRKKKLKLVAEEAMLTCEYFETLDMTNINKHVNKYLYKCLVDYCFETLHFGEKTVYQIVPDCLARMYEVIMNGMCLYNYERYCKKLLLNYKKKGNFGLTGKIPKPIQLNIQQLNLECLWEKFGKRMNK